MDIKFVEVIEGYRENIRENNGKPSLESKIQKFIHDNPNVEIVNITQSGEDCITVCIWYKIKD